MSFRDIGFILKKHGLSHGIAMTEDDDKNENKCSSEKATQAYKLFDEGKKPIELAIELNLREVQVNKIFREFWKLKRQTDRPAKIFFNIIFYQRNLN